MPVRGEYVIYLSTNPRQREASPSPPTSIFSVPTYCESNLSKNREIEFNAGTHDETIRMAFDDFRRMVRPKLVHFVQPYYQVVQRLAAA